MSEAFNMNALCISESCKKRKLEGPGASGKLVHREILCKGQRPASMTLQRCVIPGYLFSKVRDPFFTGNSANCGQSLHLLVSFVIILSGIHFTHPSRSQCAEIFWLLV